MPHLNTFIDFTKSIKRQLSFEIADYGKILRVRGRSCAHLESSHQRRGASFMPQFI
eukprot:jgi/Botrbrau1/15358/Bobra.0304s0002.1